MKIDRRLYKLSKRLDRADTKNEENGKGRESLIELEKLRRFDLYSAIRFEKYQIQGGDPAFGSFFKEELTEEEFEYHLSLNLNIDPKERYKRRKQMYYFHPSYIEMEKMINWRERAKTKYCTGYQCIPDCPYYEENGIIKDEHIIGEFMNDTEIIGFEDYRRELGEEVTDSITKGWNFSEIMPN